MNDDTEQLDAEYLGRHRRGSRMRQAKRLGLRVALPLALLAAAAVAIPLALTASTPRVYFSGDVLGKVRQRPTSIHLYSDEDIVNINWSSWGGISAGGSGTAMYPNPSAILHTPIPATLVLSNLKRCGTSLHYLRLKITYSTSPPSPDTNPLVVNYTCTSPESTPAGPTTTASTPTASTPTPTPTQSAGTPGQTPNPTAVVLGAKSFAPHGNGFGTVRPSDIFNGGDPSGHVSQIRWTGWGSSTAYGTGMSSIFKPTGGYYPQLVRVELRADQLGSCVPGGPLAYRRLSAQEPSVPGGALGPWRKWSTSGDICSPP